MSESNGLPYTGEAIAKDAMSPAKSTTDVARESAPLNGHLELQEDLKQRPPLDPSLDVDAWWAQREDMIAQLRARRLDLLGQLLETDRKLRVLGVEVPAPSAARPVEQPKAKRGPGRPKAEPGDLKVGDPEVIEKLRGALKTKPVPVSTLARRTGIGDLRLLRGTLAGMVTNGEVKRSGRGGAFFASVK